LQRLDLAGTSRATKGNLQKGTEIGFFLVEAIIMQGTGKKADDEAASEKIGQKIMELGDWRGEALARVRALILEADPEIVEEWKWVKPTNPGTPVWSRSGGICTGETYKNAVKLTFFKGASLEDPSGLFNASLDGNVRRAIDIHEGDQIDAAAFKDLIRAAVQLNLAGKRKASG
jgi:hypothetical protein